MAGAREKIDRGRAAKLIPHFTELFHISREGGGVTGNINETLRPHLFGNDAQQVSASALARRVDDN